MLVYLAAAGIGTIGIADFDVVDRSNLQRQIIHGTSDIGRMKVDSAKDRILDMNPNINVITHTSPLTSDNAMEIIPEYDVIINGADNFATRYLVNDAAFLAEKILVDGSIFLFEGQSRRSSRVRVATAACTRRHRLRAWCRPAPRPVCSACCPVRSVRSRRPKRSRSCLSKASR